MENILRFQLLKCVSLLFIEAILSFGTMVNTSPVNMGVFPDVL